MKKTLLICLLALFSVSLHAQVSNSSFTMVEGDFFDTTMTYNDTYEGSVKITNNKSTNLDYEWELVSIDSVPGWIYQMCDNRGCFPLPTTGVKSGDAVLPGEDGLMKIQVYSDSTHMGASIIKFRIWDRANRDSTAQLLTYQINIALLSAEEELLNQNVSIYPNPVLGTQLHLVSEKDRLEKGEVQILDLNGRVLLTESVGSVRSTSFEVGDLPEGMYLMRYLTDKGIVTRKFLKQQ